MKLFSVSPSVTISADYAKTRNGFRHDAVLLVNGHEVGRTKVNYLNRTWERYEYQTVMQKLVGKFAKQLTPEQKTEADAFLEHGGPQDNPMRFAAAVAAMGAIFTDTPADANKWKARMLTAGIPGLSLPDDLDKLPETEKQRRLDKVIDVAREP
jgi:hypothetical protein